MIQYKSGKTITGFNNATYDEDKFNYVDGRLRQIRYVMKKQKKLELEIYELEYYMQGLRSPAIKSPEEAMYQNSPKVYLYDKKLDYIEAIDAKKNELEKLKEQEKEWYKLLAQITDDDAFEMVFDRYYDAMSIQEIAMKYDCHHSMVSRKIHKAIEEIDI